VTVDPVAILAVLSATACCCTAPLVLVAWILFARWLRASPPRPHAATFDDYPDDDEPDT